MLLVLVLVQATGCGPLAERTEESESPATTVEGTSDPGTGEGTSSAAAGAPEERFAFDCYDVQTSDGGVARLRFDHLRGCWQVDALYD